ncbi:MAG: hypothetical protein HIU84_11985 [Acidobacteria bacterium]|nr:hypothetical protein [Acidobacteriota bacterium]
MIMFLYSHHHLVVLGPLLLGVTIVGAGFFYESCNNRVAVQRVFVAGMLVVIGMGVSGICFTFQVPSRQLIAYAKTFPVSSVRNRVLVSCLLEIPQGTPITYGDVIDCGQDLQREYRNERESQERIQEAKVHQKQIATLTAASALLSPSK